MTEVERESSGSTMIPLPMYQRTRRMVNSYLIVGLPFLLVTVVFLVLLYSTQKAATYSSLQYQNGERTINFSDKSSPQRFYENFTESETEIIGQLRTATQNHFTKTYMEDNSYLIKWLRECDWDLEEAKDMLLMHLDWREENGIDGILEEDFSFWEHEFPLYTDGIDLEGRPVYSADVSLWDLKKVVSSSKTQELVRYGYFVAERGLHSIIQAQYEGKNVTQLSMIVDLNQFNMTQHGCFSCIRNLLGFVVTAAENYPGWMYRLIFINTPEAFEIFELIMSLVAPSSRGDNKETIQIFGRNPKEWEKVVLSLISKDQLRPQFGGIKL